MERVKFDVCQVIIDPEGFVLYITINGFDNYGIYWMKFIGTSILSL